MWSLVFPSRIAVQCPALDNPPNGEVTLSNNNSAFSVATYRCDFGYIIGDVTSRTCQVDGSWSGSEPTYTGKFWQWFKRRGREGREWVREREREREREQDRWVVTSKNVTTHCTCMWRSVVVFANGKEIHFHPMCSVRTQYPQLEQTKSRLYIHS